MAELAVATAPVALTTGVITGVSAVVNLSSEWVKASQNSPTGPQNLCPCFGGLRSTLSDYEQKKFICNCTLITRDSSFLKERQHLLHRSQPVLEERGRPHKRSKWVRTILARFRRKLQRVSISRVDLARYPLGCEVSLVEPSRGTEQRIGQLATSQIPQDRKQPISVEFSFGKQPHFSLDKAKEHWASFQPATFNARDKGATPTIVMVNWTSQKIAVFIKDTGQEPAKYYRNYQVHRPNLALFEEAFFEYAVLTGVVEGGLLTGINCQIVAAKDNLKCPLKSVNSWTHLGFRDDYNGPIRGSQFQFLAMKRAAVMGIIENLYVDPALLDVIITEKGNRCKEFVQIRSRCEGLVTKDDNIFTVFAFNANADCNERVLVG